MDTPTGTTRRPMTVRERTEPERQVRDTGMSHTSGRVTADDNDGEPDWLAEQPGQREDVGVDGAAE